MQSQNVLEPRIAVSVGAILTKMDGDSRGGAALSVREVSGRPIKFVGMGEKLEALEPFYPDRLASRILGMGAPAVERFCGRSYREVSYKQQFDV